MNAEIFLEKMTWPEVKERLKESDIAIIVVGAIEAHGPHLPLETDLKEVWEITRRAAEKVADDVKPVIAPPIPYGVSTSLISFPGTITLRDETLKAVIKDVCKSLVHHGFKKLVIMNGHGGNPPSINAAIQELTNETEAFIINVEWFGGLGGDIICENTETHMIFHACEAETSVAWACGARVLMDKAEKCMPEAPSKYIKFNLYAPYPVVHAALGSILSFDKISDTGVIGDPTLASKEKGEKIVAAIVDRLADLLRELKAIKV